MNLNFGKYTEEGNTFLSYLAKALGHPNDIEETKNTLCSIVYGIRNSLSFEKANVLFDHLPPPLKAMYLEGWSARRADPSQISTIDDLIHEIRKTGSMYLVDFVDKEDAIQAIGSVFRLISCYVSFQQMHTILKLFPDKIKKHIEQFVVKRRMPPSLIESACT